LPPVEAGCRPWADGEFLRLVERWVDFAPSPGGFLRSDADVSWRPRGENTASLVSQTRLLFTFGRGLRRLDQNRNHAALLEKLRSALAAGTGFLVKTFRDDRRGGWFQAADAAGRITDDRKDLYGHAFVILALAETAGLPGLPAADADALVLECVNTAVGRFRDASGGFIRHMNRDFTVDLDDKRTQNPVMHLFEALSAAAHSPALPAQTRKTALAAAEEVLNFVLHTLFSDGKHCLPEYYDNAWRELPPENGGRIDIGHQFEWSFLLRSTPLTHGVQAAEIAARRSELLQFGVENGVIRPSGAVRSNLDSPPDAPIVWWTQCEAVRALHAAGGEDEELFAAAFDFYRKFFADEQQGGCYGTVTPDGRPIDTNKGSLWKAAYHETGMLLELARHAV